MLSEAERENTKLVLIELFGLCDKRSSSYGNILFCSAMTRAFDGNWRNVTSFFLLWFAKTLADFEINDIAALPPLFCYNSYLCFDSSACASEHWFASCARVGASYSRIWRYVNNSSASAAKTTSARQGLLGRHSSILVRMATIPHCGHAGNRGALAQGRIPFVLEADLQGQEARRATTDIEGSSGIDLPNGC